MSTPSLADALRVAQELREQGKTIVLTTGTYDILHVGHIRSLFEAAQQADALLVAVNSDSSVKQYKSPDRPINGQEHRLEAIAALRPVSYAFLFEQPDPSDVIRAIRPDVYANSVDYGENPIEMPAVQEVGARLHLLRKHAGLSTTELIEKICR